MKKWHLFNSPKRWRDSVTASLAILAGLQTVAEVSGFFEVDWVINISWWWKLLIIFFILIILTTSIFGLKNHKAHRGLKLNVGDNDVIIKEADIFTQKGLRLIPFNERFDTTVDNKVIAHNSLNGVFIDYHIDGDIESLKRCIENAPDVEGMSAQNKEGNKVFPLGRIITYNDEYLLLAFTHFDKNNTAYLTHSDYETCLLNMWQEIRNVYANRPIFIPLLGSGITTFKNTPHKDNFSLAKCILCTLKMSGVHLKQPITICLTNEVMDSINIYELKS